MGVRRPELPALTGLRFFAAMHVLVLHSMHATWLPGPLRSVVKAGYTSTSLLFILSGFVLVWVYTTPDGAFRGTRRAFWAARVARVYPIMVAAHLLAVPVWLRANDGGALAGHAALALSAQQGWYPPLANVLNAPAWAVTFLLFAYALFPWMAPWTWKIRERRLVPALVAAWVLCVLPGAVFLLLPDPGETARTALYTFPLLRLPEFVFGVLLGRWFIARGRLSPRAGERAVLAALAVWAAVMLAGAYIPRELFHNGLLAPVQGLLVVGLASGGGALGRLLSTRPVKKLGEAALAVFLLHVPLLAWVQVLGLLPGATLAASAAAYAGYLVLTIGTSLLAMRWLVDPVAAWARAKVGRAPLREPAPAAEEGDPAQARLTAA